MKYFLSLIVFLSCLFSQAQDRLQMPDAPIDLMIDIGLNYWSEVGEGMQQRGWPSKSLSFFIVNRKKISNKFFFQYGGGISFEKIGFETDRFIPIQIDSTSAYSFVESTPPFEGASSRKYKLASTFIDIPLELRFHPTGSFAGEGLFIGVGGIAGLKIKVYDKGVYELNGDRLVVKNIGNFNMNNFRYGIQLRIGLRKVHFFYKQYFNNTFNARIAASTLAVPSDPENSPRVESTFNPTTVTFGINFTGF